MPETAIRVAVCGPLQFLQEALASVLQQRYKLDVAHFVLPQEYSEEDAKTLLDQVQQFHPEVVLFLPPVKETTRSLDLIEAFVALDAKVLLVTYTEHETRQLVHEAVLRGVVGVIPSSMPLMLLSRAIYKVFEGELWLDRALTALVLNSLTRSEMGNSKDKTQEKIESLTDREREVIRWLAKGLKNRDIAERMSISESTVRHHFTSIFNKLDMNNRVELLLFALKHNLVSMDEILS
ncbi:MAG: DNA-binding response regulator [Ardenticatenia bacterium]|nr:MAG: DNA-binding response regulator [Ardenticatenia bacterium]